MQKCCFTLLIILNISGPIQDLSWNAMVAPKWVLLSTSVKNFFCNFFSCFCPFFLFCLFCFFAAIFVDRNAPLASCSRIGPAYSIEALAYIVYKLSRFIGIKSHIHLVISHLKSYFFDLLVGTRGYDMSKYLAFDEIWQYVLLSHH